jgi:hypothetical protein
MQVMSVCVNVCLPCAVEGDMDAPHKLKWLPGGTTAANKSEWIQMLQVGAKVRLTRAHQLYAADVETYQEYHKLALVLIDRAGQSSGDETDDESEF